MEQRRRRIIIEISGNLTKDQEEALKHLKKAFRLVSAGEEHRFKPERIKVEHFDQKKLK